MTHLGAKLGDGSYQPVIDRVFPLTQVADAYRHMEAGNQIGKIVVACG